MGRLDLARLNSIHPIIECQQDCSCDPHECKRRVVQNGCQVKLDVVETNGKGFGLITRDPIRAGSFVIEYMGELIGRDEAMRLLGERHGEPNYLMFIRESYERTREEKVTIIDAKHYANRARFINHSCQPNLFLMPVRFDNMMAHGALFALRDIDAGAELSYDYHGSIGSPTSGSNETERSSIKCHCGSLECKGFLPS